jgi:hypothetical protein
MGYYFFTPLFLENKQWGEGGAQSVQLSIIGYPRPSTAHKKCPIHSSPIGNRRLFAYIKRFCCHFLLYLISWIFSFSGPLTNINYLYSFLLSHFFVDNGQTISCLSLPKHFVSVLWEKFVVYCLQTCTFSIALVSFTAYMPFVLINPTHRNMCIWEWGLSLAGLLLWMARVWSAAAPTSVLPTASSYGSRWYQLSEHTRVR